MGADAALTRFLTARQATLTAAFEAGNVAEIMKHYDEGLTFSDHGMFVLSHRCPPLTG
jgi:hypothetical protein